VSTWQIVLTKQAEKDAKKVASAGLKKKQFLFCVCLRTTRFKLLRLTKNLLVIYKATTRGELIFNTDWCTKSLKEKKR